MADSNSDVLTLVRSLQERIDKLEAEAEIRKLHFKYGYYRTWCECAIPSYLILLTLLGQSTNASTAKQSHSSPIIRPPTSNSSTAASTAWTA